MLKFLVSNERDIEERFCLNDYSDPKNMEEL